MVSKAQLRILAWLNKHPESLETSWDVTREVSLPGIAEGLGVVRSALNLPLSKLERSELIFKRMAHVVGGGSRRRQIYHITPKGRAHLEENDVDFSKHRTTFEIVGNPPTIDEIFGRKKEREKCLEILNEKSLLVSGMPGIGKSAFVLSLCQELAQKNTVRWAVADQFSDYSTITSSWYLDELFPSDIDSICLKLQNSEDILVIDDINLVSQRHIDSLQELVGKLCDISKVRLILISRESSGSFQDLSNFKLDALDLTSCCAMLGEHTDKSNRENIAKSLGNHPLALKLYQPEYNVPESSSNVIEYVENVVLNGLSKQQKVMISNLSLEPVMIEAKNSIIAEEIDFFDEQNLVRWDGDRFFELQYLIRNVSRSNMSEDERKAIHETLAAHWLIQESKGAKENYFYHLSRSNTSNFISQLSEQIYRLEDFDTAALATVVSDSIYHNGPEKNLVYIESKIAQQRFEPAIIRKNLDHLNGDELLEMQFVLAQIEGRTEDCEQMLDDVLQNKTPLEKARTLILVASQTLEDRLPSSPVSKKVEQKIENYLKQIELKEIGQERQSIIVAISLIKHSIAIANNNFATGLEIIESLSNIGSIDDSIIIHLQTKEAIAEYVLGTKTLEQVTNFVEANCQQIDNLLMAESLKLRFVEVLLADNIEAAKTRFNQLTKPDNFTRSNTSIRYSARWWLVHSKIFSSSSKSSLRESLMKFREAGCGNVAAELESKFHTQV